MSDLWPILSTIFAGGSAVAATVAIVTQHNAQNSKDLLDQAILSLERAYEVLAKGSTPDAMIIPDRLNWLTCARHIESYKSLKGQLTRQPHRHICEEHEEYWRHQFYLSLNSSTIISPAYYDQDGAKNKARIDPKSAMIVHSFATWPKDKVDPLDAVNVDRLAQDSDCLNANIGLRLYTRSFDQFRHLADRH